jgi:hypothetical protein
MDDPRPDGLGEILDDSDLRAAGAAHKVTLTLKIRRYNPEVRGEESWWDEFEIQADPDDRLLDALHQVKWYHDGTLALRRSCAHGICGSDAMMIDGKNALACKIIVRDIAPKVTVEPIRGLPVLKDLIVDMEPFFAGYRSVLPYLINDSGEPDTERLQSPEDRQVHPVRRVHDLLPDLLGRRGVRRTRRDRECPPVRLRLPRRGREGTPEDPLGEDGRVPLPDHVQLHRGLSSRHRGDQGDPGSEALDPVRPVLRRTDAR